MKSLCYIREDLVKDNAYVYIKGTPLATCHCQMGLVSSKVIQLEIL